MDTKTEIREFLTSWRARRAHLFDHARAAQPAAPARRPAKQRVRPGVQRILVAMTGTPAFVRDGC